MSIQTITHVEYHCADAARTAAELQTGFGFLRDSDQPGCKPGVQTVHLHQGTIRLRLHSSENTDDPVARYVERHGEGVAVLALGCTDPQAALERAERH
ncbi:VOC family protein, partial [Streptomyces sp. SID3343]|uniref:VOC family protein n=1 Tax=Streptomyces sp. SID3343 TaxID=2690260 RepID=UPI0013BF4777